MKKEMVNVIIAFELMDFDSPVPVGYTKTPLRIIFALKEIVFVFFLNAASKDLNIQMTDLGSVYFLNAVTKARCHANSG